MARRLGSYRLPSGVQWSCYGPPPAGAVEIPDPAAPVDDSPAKGARKVEWVDHAVALGIPRDEAEAATKAALLERVEELVAAAERGSPVGSDVELVDDGPQGEQVSTGPGVDGTPVGQDTDGDSHVVGHED